MLSPREGKRGGRESRPSIWFILPSLERAARVGYSARRKKFRRIDRPRGTLTGVFFCCIYSRLFLVGIFLHSL